MNAYQRIANSNLTAVEIAGLCNAICLRPNGRTITSVELDSRQCGNGSLFFALKGEKTDGSAFLSDVDAKQAAAVVVSEEHVAKALSSFSGSVLVVKNVKESLHALAKSYAKRYGQVTNIGVTGSCGKSTTKEAIAKIASVLGPTAKTPGNLNSEYGLPLSMFALDGQTRYGVFEMGIDHVGEMDRMVDMLQPSIALVTNIGLSHVEKMGSPRIIAEQKARIFHTGLQAGFVSEACHYQQVLQKQARMPLIRYALSDIQARDLGLQGWEITYQGIQFRVRSVGRHLLEDVVGAIKVGQYLGADREQIATALEGFEPMDGRSFVHQSKVTIVDDSYNANPDSTTSILNYLSSLSWRGTKKVVLGPMKELGSLSPQAHRKVGMTLAATSFQKAYLYGREMEETARNLRRYGYRGHVVYTKDFEELEHVVHAQTREGDLFLLKASRSVAMERLIPSIRSATDRRRVHYA